MKLLKKILLETKDLNYNFVIKVILKKHYNHVYIKNYIFALYIECCCSNY